MNINCIKNITVAAISIVILLPLSSCIKDNFTVPSPGANINPAGVQATMTIKQFKQLHYVPVLGVALPTLMTDSQVISGVINADDRSGNFYKTLCLQDSTGGIQIKIDGTNLYYTYPIGRRIWIKTKGLYIFDYGGTAEIGGYIDLAGSHPAVGAIALENAPNSIITGEWGIPVVPKKVKISDLTAPLFTTYIDQQSILYEIDSVEYSQQDTAGLTYGNALTKGSNSLVLNDCNGYSMVVYSSGYASFANARPSKGHGNIVGIYNYYSFSSSGNYEFIIRDTTDVMFTSSQRCH
ncbi:unnamed protein product [Sphagnum balticum]|jgi:hypothetical protein